MLSFHTWAAIEGALDLPLAPSLRSLLAPRIARLPTMYLTNLTHLLVIEPGDTEADIRYEVGFSLLENPLDRVRFGSPGFQPFWDALYQHEGWYELIVTIGNTGFACVFFIQDTQGVDPRLLALCRAYVQ